MANALTKTPHTQFLNLSDIRTDGGTQARAGLDPAVVAEYAGAIGEGADFPPLVVFSDGEELWLADGFHRLAAYLAAGVEGVDCLLKHGTQRDAVLWSVGANSTHGLRRSNQDKRNAVNKLLGDAEWVQWSDREIAKRCGVSHTFVAINRASLEILPVTDPHQDDAVEDEPRTYVDKHGHISTMNVAKIGSKPAAALEGGPAIGLSKEDYDAELAQMRAEYLERLPAEVELLRAQLESAQADDLKAEAMKWRQMSEHHMREQSYAMDRAKEARDREAWVMKQLRRCGKAVGEDDPGKIAAQIEAFVRRTREAA